MSGSYSKNNFFIFSLFASILAQRYKKNPTYANLRGTFSKLPVFLQEFALSIFFDNAKRDFTFNNYYEPYNQVYCIPHHPELCRFARRSFFLSIGTY